MEENKNVFNLSQDEINELNEIQLSYNELSISIGQLNISKWEIEKDLTLLKSQHLKLSERDKDIAIKLKAKYGENISIDLDNAKVIVNI